MIPQKVWLVIFLIGVVFLIYKIVREPIWAAVSAGYFYFAIPTNEFGAPEFPLAAILWGVAVLTSIRYVWAFHSSAKTEIEQVGLHVAQNAIEAVRQEMKEALAGAALRGALPGEIRHAALQIAEPKAIGFVDETSPRPIVTMVRRGVQAVLMHAADAGETEARRVLESVGHVTKGNLRVTLEARVYPVVDQALDSKLAPDVSEQVQRGIESDEREAARDQTKASLGPLGIPMPRGPLTGILTNPGLWLHVAFIVLTYVGALNAKYDVEKAMTRFGQTLLLLIPMVAIACAVRNERHVRMFALAWMAGTVHLCMNATSYWAQNGGRADQPGGQGGESNFLGAITVTIAPVAFGMALNARVPWQKVAGGIFSGIYTLGILACGSRAALIALLGGVGYWLFNTNKKGMAIGGAVIGAACFLVVAPEDFWVRMGTIVGEIDKNPWVRTTVEPSKHERQVLWALAIDIFLDNPLMGIGPRQYVFESADKTDFVDAYNQQRGLQAHNMWLQLAAEYGILGILVWGGAFVLAMVCYTRARMRMKKYPGWEWYVSMCLGFEAGTIGNAISCTFNSFQWYDYHYWHFVFGPIVYQVAKETSERLDWMMPADRKSDRPPPRYGPPEAEGLDLESIDLSSAAPLRSDTSRV